MNQCYRLGIDIGSTTVKVAVIDDNNKILFADYERYYANIQETSGLASKKCKENSSVNSLTPKYYRFRGLTLSGYLHIPFVQEVVAVATALQDYASWTDVAIELLAARTRKSSTYRRNRPAYERDLRRRYRFLYRPDGFFISRRMPWS